MCLRTSKWDKRLVVVLGKGSCITYIWCQRVQISCVKFWLWTVLRGEKRKYGINVKGILPLTTCRKPFPSLFFRLDIPNFRCEVCELIESHCTSFPSSARKSSIPFMIIHFAVSDPSRVATLDGAHWFVTFIDDCTRMIWVCLMNSKGEVNFLVHKLHAMILTQCKAQV